MKDQTEWVGHRTVTEEAVATFASLTGDFSRIHVDQRFGAASPLGTGFAHGLLSASWALGSMTRCAGELIGCADPDSYVSDFAIRFQSPVLFGDTLSVACQEVRVSDLPKNGGTRQVEFSLANQRDTISATGRLGIRKRAVGHTPNPWEANPAKPWPIEKSALPAPSRALGAEEIVELGPRGSLPIRSITETDIVNFANFSGDPNPLSLDAEFSKKAIFGSLTASPMLSFSLGFAVWLSELMKLPMAGSPSEAGHLGDRWQVIAPVFVGDTLELRYRPLNARRTQSRPHLAVTTFGLQILNQREEVVLQGEADMMLPTLDDPRESEGR
ncbi:MAG: MaoC/PaaZ C-terminal domain-containing protein [Myxococcota bacterium]|nr:MaoC/PaaZ C-terminal domain-containing protein [Myxococcota bacterium]